MTGLMGVWAEHGHEYLRALLTRLLANAPPTPVSPGLARVVKANKAGAR